MATVGNRRPELISTREAAARLCVHPETLRRLVRDGEVSAVRLRAGGWLKFRLRDIERLTGPTREAAVLREADALALEGVLLPAEDVCARVRGGGAR